MHRVGAGPKEFWSSMSGMSWAQRIKPSRPQIAALSLVFFMLSGVGSVLAASSDSDTSVSVSAPATVAPGDSFQATAVVTFVSGNGAARLVWTFTYPTALGVPSVNFPGCGTPPTVTHSSGQVGFDASRGCDNKVLKAGHTFSAVLTFGPATDGDYPLTVALVEPTPDANASNDTASTTVTVGTGTTTTTVAPTTTTTVAPTVTTAPSVSTTGAGIGFAESLGAPYLVATPGELVLRFTTYVDSTFRFEPLDLVDSPNPGRLVMTSFDTRSAMGAEVEHGSLVYTPPPGFVGEDSYTFVVSDGLAQTRFTVLMSVLPGSIPLEGSTAVPAVTLPDEAIGFVSLPFTGPSILTPMLLLSGLMVLVTGASLLAAERRTSAEDD
jgi:hypothetical protein